jgi:hypothetical protein
MIAFIFTGNPRTFHKTHRLIYDNLLSCQRSPYHIFVLCETSDPSFEETVRGAWGRGCGSGDGDGGSTIKIMESTRTPAFVDLVEYLLVHKPAFRNLERDHFPADFFRKSGCILEYYQFMLAYDLMLDYERNHPGIHFDAVVRSRFDVVLTEPMVIRKRDAGQVEIPEPIVRRAAGHHHHHHPPQVMAKLFDYPNGPPPADNTTGMITLYCNWIWIAARDVMDLMHRFVYCFGDYATDSRHCFNSENQFMLHLKHHNVQLYTYFTVKEWETWTEHENCGRQLVDDSGNWVLGDPDILVAIIRN